MFIKYFDISGGLIYTHINPPDMKEGEQMTLKEIRQSAKLLQTSVAEQMNVPQSSVSQWESGDCYPHPSKISKLACLYNVTADEILKACDVANMRKNLSDKQESI